MIRHLPTLLCLSFLAATLGFTTPAHAVSIYDVIQLSKNGYGERDIVRILDATNSAFELTADDVIRLKRLGVGETVVQRMLVSSAEERPEWRPVKEDRARATAPAGGSGASGARYHHDEYHQTDGHSVVRRPQSDAEAGEADGTNTPAGGEEAAP
jgi:hypothetical protein